MSSTYFVKELVKSIIGNLDFTGGKHAVPVNFAILTLEDVWDHVDYGIYLIFHHGKNLIPLSQMRQGTEDGDKPLRQRIYETLEGVISIRNRRDFDGSNQPVISPLKTNACDRNKLLKSF